MVIMNYLDLEQSWLEWETDLREEDQYHCYIDGQNDALTLEIPQEPDNYCYMQGWQDTKDKLAAGDPQVCNALIKASIKQSDLDHWEEF